MESGGRRPGHRQGSQNRPTEYGGGYKHIARGTIEEKVYKLQEKKREIIKNVIGEDMDGENILTAMTEEEVKGLFEDVAL